MTRNATGRDCGFDNGDVRSSGQHRRGVVLFLFGFLFGLERLTTPAKKDVGGVGRFYLALWRFKGMQ